MGDVPFPDRAALHSHQLEQLRQLLRTIVPANRFYTGKLRASDVDLGLPTLEHFQQLPFTTKAELVADQQASPPHGTNLTFPIAQYCRYHHTSGTTGTPLRWLDTAQSWDWMVQRWIEIFRAAEVGSGDRIVFAFSFGPFIGFWLAFDAGTRLGALCLPAGGLSTTARLRLIIDNQATVLCCTPTYALHLAEVALQENLDLSRARLRRIIVAGEPGGSIPTTRARLEEVWPGARVFDHHGMTETGPVSYECPARPGVLHIMESGFVAEIVDPATGQAAKPGATGELILTNLGRTGSPLIRYRTGDLVRVDDFSFRASEKKDPPGHSEACACGRLDLALKGGILGRVDDMVIVRGVNVYPTAVEDVLRACGGVAEYQVKVTRSGVLRELMLVIEPEPDCRDVEGLAGLIKKRFQQAFALRVPVEVVPAGSLPRFEMKAKRWVTQ
jgi:phenylacetate-CoA ligase